MNFCPKCGGILIPKKEGNKKWFACTCGYKTKDIKEAKLTESVEESKSVEVIEKSEDQQILPEIEAECPKCQHTKAYYWTVQTRAADEPPTKFFWHNTALDTTLASCRP